MPAKGFEINPLLSIVGQYSLVWNQYDADVIEAYLDVLKEHICRFSEKTLEETLKILPTSLPNIHDVFRWWRSNVLRDMLIARHLAERTEFSSVREFLWLAVNKASIECANIHRNHPTITFDDDHQRKIDVFKTLELNLLEQMEDIGKPV